jgi:hypothetical protein
MSEILFQYYRVNPTTWVYISSIMVVGLYFKFGRFWSVRNLDLLLLILLAPGLLTAQYGGEARVKAEQLLARERLEIAQNALVRPIDAPSRGLADISPTAEVRGEEAGPIESATSTNPEVASGADSAVEASTAEGAINPTASESGETRLPEDDRVAENSAAADAELSPAQALLEHSINVERLGYLWLFAVGAIWLVRLLLDPTMVRRPLLEPNLTAGGLIFSGVSLFLFLMANVWTSQSLVNEPNVELAADELTVEPGAISESSGSLPRGPGYALLNLIPSIPTSPLVPEGVVASSAERAHIITAKVIVITCHLAVVLGIVAVGYWHFASMKTGVGVATLYLMLPYTAQMTGHIDHVIPAALLVWAVMCYRRPLTAGLFIGLAMSLVYFPLFLLPLWISFYWRRGLMRFATGVVATLLVMAISLVFIPETSYWENLQQMFGLWLPQQEGLEGIWGLGWNPFYRIPILAAFIAMSCTFAIWPAQKNLGTLLSCSAAVMVATQFAHGYGGGLYMGWYLPLALLTVFRPNLEDRVALAVLGEGWGRTRAANLISGFKAA